MLLQETPRTLQNKPHSTLPEHWYRRAEKTRKGRIKKKNSKTKINLQMSNPIRMGENSVRTEGRKQLLLLSDFNLAEGIAATPLPPLRTLSI